MKNPTAENLLLDLSSPDTEQAVLGSLLIDKEVIYLVSGDMSEALFYDKQNKLVIRAILDLFLRNEPADILTVTNELKKTAKLGEAGGAAYVSKLTTKIASTANVEVHVKILQQYFLSRYINEVCNESRFKLFNGAHDIFDVYSEMQNKLEDALKDVIRHEISGVRDIHVESMRNALELARSGSKSGVITGLSNVDNLTNGWQKSDLIIIAGRSGMGKTALAISLAMNPAIMAKQPVAIFSLEMSKTQLVGRMQSGLSGINVSRIIKNQLSEEEVIKIDTDSKFLYNAPIFIDDSPNISLTELKMKARKLVREHGVKLIIIDYLQLMRSGLKTNNREQEVAEISKGLKVIAKELDVPVIALSQLSRAVEQRGGDKKPMLSDLRESGQIEQDADMVVFCYRPEYYGFSDYQVGIRNFDANGLFMFIVAKHRNGELGEIPLTFVHELTKVTNHGEQDRLTAAFSPTFNNNINVLGREFETDNTNTDVAILTPKNLGEDELPF